MKIKIILDEDTAKTKTPDIPMLWDVRRKILNVLPPNFRNIILLCRNAVSLFPNTPDFHRIYSYPDNVGHTATVTTKCFGFPVLLTNPFTIPLPYQDPTIPDSLCCRSAGYLPLL